MTKGPLPILAFFAFIIWIGHIFTPAETGPTGKKKKQETKEELYQIIEAKEAEIERIRGQYYLANRTIRRLDAEAKAEAQEVGAETKPALVDKNDEKADQVWLGQTPTEKNGRHFNTVMPGQKADTTRPWPPLDKPEYGEEE